MLEMFDQQHHDYRRLEVSRSLSPGPDTNYNPCTTITLRSSLPISNDEAGLYITSYKKLEHKPPTMIKERVDKDHSSVFRSALTSISKVNKTDVETLRSSVGVWGFTRPCHFLRG